ncbi:hypothetical protein LSCM1_07749 [Leishmania martiniquensis]|uniref:protein-tyrosine-phosphatase n=1 Tax=Leishmania martiniquensis TaxID=1580590 RepID=A0A836H778_9TRYP|nr:hypothetical protein LSCM1_07749 [Leishmania martiniquensis]
MPAGPQQRQPPSKQRLQRCKGSGSSSSQTSSPFVHGAPSSPSPALASSTAATSGSAGGDKSARSSNRGDGAETTSAGSGDGDDGDSNGGSVNSAAGPKSTCAGRNQRGPRRHLRRSPRVASGRKAKSGAGMIAPGSGSGLNTAAAAATISSSASFSSPLQAPGEHFAHRRPPSSRSDSNPNCRGADMQSTKSSGDSGSGSCLAAAQAARESEPSSPAVWVSDFSGGGSGATEPFHDSSNDDMRQTEDRCTQSTAVSLSGGSGVGGHVWSLSQAASATANVTPLTYAAVASSSAHGKRLPQSRVKFSQWRKCMSNGSASAPSTIGGANITEAPGHATAAVSLSSTLASTLRTLKVPSVTTTVSTSRATGKSVPTSPSVADIEGDAENVGGVKTRPPNSGEHDMNGGPPQASANAMMPPLPPSVHRHKPMHLILELPNAPQSQQARSSLEKDEGVPDFSSPHISHTQGTAAVARPSGLSIDVVPFTHSPTSSQSICASEVTPVTRVRTLGSPACAYYQQQQQPNIGKPFRTLSPIALHPKGAATAAVAADNATHRLSTTATLFGAVEVLPGLFLGSYADATDTEALAAHGISLVINCTKECPVTSAMASNSHHVRYIQCPLRDHSDEAIAPFFTPVTRIIHDQLHRRQVSQLRMARRAAANAWGAEVNDTEERHAQERMLWAWTDEAENVWAARSSPVSTPLSVSGQPSFKESKRETPRTPSSAPGIGALFGEGARCSSTTTSCSPSPMPGRNATFPSITAAAAAGGTVDLSSAMQKSSNASANMSLITPPQSCGSTALAAANLTVATAPPPEATALTLLVSAITPPAASASAPLTIVDPRDCGGVLVCCRMGVSRSASFIIAYLILYGCTLAPLDDAASLFVYFLERERRIIEEAGGLASFTDKNAGGASATASPTTATVPASWGRCGGEAHSPASASASFTSRASRSVVSAGQSSPKHMLRTTSPWHRRRSAAIPVASPLTSGGSGFGGGCAAGSLATPQSANASASSQQQRLCGASPPTPIELASRLCQPCWFMRLRERRLQQQPKRQLLLSGRQQRTEQRDAEQQVVALCATCLSVKERRHGCRSPDGVESNLNADGSSNCTTGGGYGSVHPEVQQHHHPCRVYSTFPSSAPVASYRSARGRYTATLLEAAYADERVTEDDDVEEEEEAQQPRILEAARTLQQDGAQVANRSVPGGLESAPAVTCAAQSVQDTVPTDKMCVAVEEAVATALRRSAVTDAPPGHSRNAYRAPPSLREQQLVLLRSPYTLRSPQPPVSGNAHGDVNSSLNTLLGVSFASSGGGSVSAFGGAAPAMTYRDAFDAVKRRKADVNPNIGFVLALRELAGGGDFSLSASL